jgi:hypothetical protein
MKAFFGEIFDEAHLKKQAINSIGMKLTLVPSGEFMMGGGESAEATAAFFQRVAQPHFVNPLRTIPARTEGLIARG